MILWQENWGEIDWPVDWREEQFEGDFTIDAVQAGFAFPFPEGGEEEGEGGRAVPGGRGAGPGPGRVGGDHVRHRRTIRFLGDQTFLPMVGDETGLGRIEGVFAGVEAGTAAGVLVRFNHEVQSPIDAGVILAALGSVVESRTRPRTSRSSPSTRRRSRPPAGRSLPASGRPPGRARDPVDVPAADRPASTTADGEVKLPLSKDRAEATYQAMRALLGPAFSVHEANTFIGHRGEYDALKALPTTPRRPTWRRVDIWLDSSLLVGI